MQSLPFSPVVGSSSRTKDRTEMLDTKYCKLDVLRLLIGNANRERSRGEIHRT